MKVEFVESPENHKVYARLNSLERLTKRAVRQGLFKWARDLKKIANAEILSKDKTGRLYFRKTRSGGRRRHRASSPCETHANMTGTLRRSIGWVVPGSDRLEFGYGFAPGLTAPDYAGFVEFGTFKMKARPSLQNAIKDTQGRAETYFKTELKKLDEI